MWFCWLRGLCIWTRHCECWIFYEVNCWFGNFYYALLYVDNGFYVCVPSFCYNWKARENLWFLYFKIICISRHVLFTRTAQGNEQDVSVRVFYLQYGSRNRDWIRGLGLHKSQSGGFDFMLNTWIGSLNLFGCGRCLVKLLCQDLATKVQDIILTALLKALPNF